MSDMTAEIRLQRVYDHEKPTGRVFLVDRMWPRGVKKEDLALDGWLRDAAPSTELRRWFGHRPDRFPEFAATGPSWTPVGRPCDR
jgi:uncharacterized protein YeaO (DUF488 family)